MANERVASGTNFDGVRDTRSNYIGRTIAYIFGRNTFIGIASLMLLAISGFATWSGMNDFIVGVSTSPAAQRRDIGGLSVTNEMLVITIVIALTFLMWVCLRESFREAAPKSRSQVSTLAAVFATVLLPSRSICFLHSRRLDLVMASSGVLSQVRKQQ